MSINCPLVVLCFLIWNYNLLKISIVRCGIRTHDHSCELEFKPNAFDRSANLTLLYCRPKKQIYQSQQKCSLVFVLLFSYSTLSQRRFLLHFMVQIKLYCNYSICFGSKLLFSTFLGQRNYLRLCVTSTNSMVL